MVAGANQQLVPLETALAPVKGMLARNIKGIGAALGSYMQPERFCSAVVTLCRINPDLLDPRKAEPASLLLSVLRIAHLQLSPDPALGQAWVIPRKGKAEMQLGYKGCIQLAYRSPLVAAVRYGVVGPKCRFVWRDGKDWVLEHEPSEEGWPETLGEVRAAWTIIDLRSGKQLPRVMYLPEILRHKARGMGAQPAWISDPAAMSVKTVIGDCCRRGPFEGELGRAFAIDHMGEVGLGQPAAAEESGFLDIELAGNGESKNIRSASERFKAAHRPANPEPEPAPIETKTVATEPERQPGEDPMEPELLSPAKAASLAKMAADAKILPEVLAAECARLAGTGNLEGMPAAYESDLLLFIRNAKRGK